MKKIVAVFISIMMFLSLSACGNSKKDLVGTYILSSISSMGVEVNYAGLETIDFLDSEITFEKDGNAELTLQGYNNSCNVNFEEKTMKSDGYVLNYEIEGNNLILFYEGEKRFVFTKVN